jgi:hypothetical protein
MGVRLEAKAAYSATVETRVKRSDVNNSFPLWPPLYLPSIFLEKRCKVAYNTEKAILFP